MIRSVLTTVAGTMVATAAMASGTITNGNASLTLPLVPVFSSTLGDANLVCDPATPDTLYKLTWYYRSPSNTNRVFSSLDTPTESYSANTATISYTNAGPGPSGQSRFGARLTMVLTDGGAPAQAIVEQRLLFTSDPANTSTQTWEVFLLIDPDIAGTPADDIASVSDPSQVRVQMSDSASATVANCYGLGASRYELSSGAALRTKLASGTASLMTAAGSSAAALGAADNAFAFQWTITLAPGQSRVLSSKYAYGEPACRADFNNTGAITVQDIFDFLAAWFAQTTFSDYNIDGTTTVQDIFDFLASWFAGC